MRGSLWRSNPHSTEGKELQRERCPKCDAWRSSCRISQLSNQSVGWNFRNETRASLSLNFSFSSDFVNFQMIKEDYFSAIWAVLYHFYHLSKVVVKIWLGGRKTWWSVCSWNRVELLNQWFKMGHLNSTELVEYSTVESGISWNFEQCIWWSPE